MKFFKFQVFHRVIVEQSEIKVGGMVRTIVSMAPSEKKEGGMVRTNLSMASSESNCWIAKSKLEKLPFAFWWFFENSWELLASCIYHLAILTGVFYLIITFKFRKISIKSC